MEFISPEQLRLDGRRPKELRQLQCEIGVLGQQADGSATFSMGNTKVLASVFGPKQASSRATEKHGMATVRCEYAMAPFSTGERRKQGRSDRRAAELSAVIRNTLEQTIILELMPQSQLDVYVHVIQADGGTRCAAINAALLALADAGVPLRDMVAACAAGYLDKTPILDMNYLEDAGGGPDVVMDKNMSLDTFSEVFTLAEQGSKVVGQFMRQQLLEHTQCQAAACMPAMPT
eukprot:jgi/Astpho2/4359/fgenesh1_pm.00066_%23_5_t